MRSIIFAAAAALLITAVNSAAFGQESSGQAAKPMAPTPLPEQCRQPEGQQMQGMAATAMPSMDTSGMDEAHRAYMEAMTRMHPAMMQGIMAEDPDVAFACGMIAHHQGAIDMAEVELQYGDNDEAKKAAQTIIDAQKHEIDDFTKWLAANAK